MTISMSQNSDHDRESFTPEEIEQTFDQLGLNDPKVREYYNNLRNLNQEKEPQVWLRTSHHTSFPQQ